MYPCSTFSLALALSLPVSPVNLKAAQDLQSVYECPLTLSHFSPAVNPNESCSRPASLSAPFYETSSTLCLTLSDSRSRSAPPSLLGKVSAKIGAKIYSALCSIAYMTRSQERLSSGFRCLGTSFSLK